MSPSETVDVGHVHTTTPDGLCLETCPHPSHAEAGMVVYAVPIAFKPLLDEWLLALGVVPAYVPSAPGDDDPARAYAVFTAGTPAAAATGGSPLDGALRGSADRRAARDASARAASAALRGRR